MNFSGNYYPEKGHELFSVYENRIAETKLSVVQRDGASIRIEDG